MIAANTPYCTKEMLTTVTPSLEIIFHTGQSAHNTSMKFVNNVCVEQKPQSWQQLDAG